MRAVVITKSGNPSVLQVQEKDTLEPTGKQLRIRVKAAGINFAEIMARKGFYPEAPPFPCILGYEVSGIVDAVGPDASIDWFGKEVVALTRFGGYADTAIIQPEHAVLKPANLSFVEAASIPVVYLTAWMLLYEAGGLRKGQTVLIQNAGGGVGLAAIDIAEHIGAISIGTASGHKHEFLKKRGLHHAIDYRNENIHDRVMQITGGVGVDLIIDPIGGDSWKKNYKLLRAGGRVGFFGASTVTTFGSNIFSKICGLISFFFQIPKWSPLDLMSTNRGVFGLNLGTMWDDDRLTRMFEQIVQGYNDGWVKPHVDSVFDFDHSCDAHEYIENRKNVGKVVLVPTEFLVKEWNKRR